MLQQTEATSIPKWPSTEDHALRAVRMALDMQAAIETLKGEVQLKGIHRPIMTYEVADRSERPSSAA